MNILQVKLDQMQADQKNGSVRLCFGSRRLFNAQFNLEQNNYASHEAWLSDWKASRSNQIFVLGSQDEIAGNQSCQASLNQDGTLDLQVRMPNALEAHGKYLVLKGIKFSYGLDVISAALNSSQRVASVTKAGAATIKRIGCALSYRFVLDAKGWRVFVSCEAQKTTTLSSKNLGAIGVDINANHLAISEVDRFGNLVNAFRMDLNTYGKSTDQAKALIGGAAVHITTFAKSRGKPLVLEKLDFAKKKAELEASYKPMARMLSSFACNKIIDSLKSSAFRAGVEAIEVNPAYTSVIGAVNYAQAKGISIHMGAATAIARRGLGLSERCPTREATVPSRNGGHVTFCVPVRNRTKHVWTQWGKVKTALKAAHAAPGRSGVPKGQPAPLISFPQSLGSTRLVTVRLRDANRQHNCSAGVLENNPT